MSSQAAEADALLPQDRRGRAVLEGESAGPAYGSADDERQGAPEAPPVVFQRNQLPNGVAPRGDRADRTRSPMRPDRSAGRPLEPPQRGQAVEAGHGQVALGNPSPDSSVFASVDSRDTMTISPPRVGDEPHQAARTLQMEYATYDNGEGQPMVRWVTARSAGFQGRFLEGLGLTGSQGTGQAEQHQHSGTPQPQIPTTQQYQQPLQQAPAASTTMSFPPRPALTFSPPEELPPPPPPVRQSASSFFGSEKVVFTRAGSTPAAAVTGSSPPVWAVCGSVVDVLFRSSGGSAKTTSAVCSKV